MAHAAASSGRSDADVQLVAVTKYVGPEVIRALAAAGCRVLGESRPQPFWEKAAALADLHLQWQMIGHLQRNKVRRTLPLVTMLQSLDSPRLASAVDRVAGELSLRLPVLVEVNISGDAAKHGFTPERIEPFLAAAPQLACIEVRGLMGMASAAGGRDQARRDFSALRQLRDRLRPNCPQGVRLDELSMGMSGDYDIAIEEGATIVRVGSALYEGIPR